jgi:hypothetical protein
MLNVDQRGYITKSAVANPGSRGGHGYRTTSGTWRYGTHAATLARFRYRHAGTEADGGQKFTHPRGDAVICHDESCWHHIPAGFRSREPLGLPPIGGRISHGHGPESLERHLHGAHA